MITLLRLSDQSLSLNVVEQLPRLRFGGYSSIKYYSETRKLLVWIRDNSGKKSQMDKGEGRDGLSN